MHKILLFILILTTVSCTDLFSTREDKVEKPDPSSKNIYTDATSPEIVLDNLKKSIEARDAERYIDNFSRPSDSLGKGFTFISDVHFQQYLVNWSHQDEDLYFSNISDDERLQSIRFKYVGDTLPEIYQWYGDSVETIPFEYEIRLSYDSLKIYKGFSTFKLFETEFSKWFIYYWEDHAIDGQSENSWSALKKEYSR